MVNITIEAADAALAELKLTHAQIVQRLEEVRLTLQAEGLTAVGSRGQLRPHPLVAVESGLRQELERVRRHTLAAQKELDFLREVGRGRERTDRINAIFRRVLTPETESPNEQHDLG